MLDSLVRVSRRVWWVADRFATDPRRPTIASPYQARGLDPLRAAWPKSNAPGRPAA
ncbi:hypothetical protein DPMN_019754 [Dreissena polymorpha]|uniref:Uncharacterized protein n=1 Tax=Dreissena polymorpha TaxID=45954 RepID=A0A9D4S7L7_DREPO|nr:hypothetical protein DPMN_043621 [Dreissena polymorpha]KAH3829347.1 hypothetical protein DPMN_131343 [Dreissena polymorpha]KAH3829388.1 hypothetical protein DPMN_131384 [Dreissena polymorpha]KAH3829404.1 hypothetical protein DPMN_131400 [Dreissena polymorpha]KAH3829420.1 hypothetical protein DPMN_131416 [Dreissena polymorpha]